MEEKKAYQKTMEKKLAELGSKIDKLQGKAEKAGGDAKAELNQQIKALKEKREAAKKKMAELNSSRRSVEKPQVRHAKCVGRTQLCCRQGYL